MENRCVNPGVTSCTMVGNSAIGDTVGAMHIDITPWLRWNKVHKVLVATYTFNHHVDLSSGPASSSPHLESFQYDVWLGDGGCCVKTSPKQEGETMTKGTFLGTSMPMASRLTGKLSGLLGFFKRLLQVFASLWFSMILMEYRYLLTSLCISMIWISMEKKLQEYLEGILLRFSKLMIYPNNGVLHWSWSTFFGCLVLKLSWGQTFARAKDKVA